MSVVIVRLESVCGVRIVTDAVPAKHGVFFSESLDEVFASAQDTV